MDSGFERRRSSASRRRGEGRDQLDEIGLTSGFGLGEDAAEMRLHGRFRNIEISSRL
jgi:hypothetical protein